MSSIIVHLLFRILIVSLFLISCDNENYKEYTISDLSKPIIDTIIYEGEENVNRIEVLISGHVRGSATLEFENGSGRFVKMEIRDVVSEKYETEWYARKILFKYTPNSNVLGDSLIFKYRIF